MKCCANCFRFHEDWRDANSKGYQVVHRGPAYAEYSIKPRPGILTKCSNVNSPNMDGRGDRKACGYYEARWLWNLKLWYDWGFKYKARRLFEAFIRVPLGGFRKPVPLKWEDYYNNSVAPVCPHCEEMPYSTEQCVFCGQRFIQDSGKGID